VPLSIGIRRVLAADIVHTDGMPAPLQGPGRDHCRTGRSRGNATTYIMVFDAAQDRSRDGPLAFLDLFRSYLQCDADAGYDEPFRRSEGAVIEVGCWARTAGSNAMGSPLDRCRSILVAVPNKPPMAAMRKFVDMQ
jgi:hypothetical protein